MDIQRHTVLITLAVPDDSTEDIQALLQAAVQQGLTGDQVPLRTLRALGPVHVEVEDGYEEMAGICQKCKAPIPEQRAFPGQPRLCDSCFEDYAEWVLDS